MNTTTTQNPLLLQQIRSTFGEVQWVLNAFSEEQINTVPFAGSWTAGQVAEHMIKFTEFLPQLCQDAAVHVTRPANEKSAGIRQLFSDHSQKFTSPEFILPIGTYHSKAQLMQRFGEIEKALLQAVSIQNLALLCPNPELPVFGCLTRLEWVEFALVHLQRHLHQLNTIHGTLKTQQT